MILRKQKIAALLLLLPVLSSALVVDVDGNGVQKVRDAQKDSASATNKLEVGTKDAPVDGYDGKPHDGPFVVADIKDKPAKGSDSTKATSTESLSDTIMVDQKKISSELLTDKDIGVMDDPDRISPKKGTTGTEGGVTQRTKEHKALEQEKGEKLGKVPVSPDEERPLSNDEQERMGVDTADEEDADLLSASEKAKGAAGLAVCGLHSPKQVSEPQLEKKANDLLPQKPTDLPDTPHGDSGSSKPVIPSMPKDSYDSSKTSTTVAEDEGEEGLIQPFHSFVLSFMMIIFSEIGDKTFLVAALMAMRHPRLVVFTAAFAALITMTVLSAVLGHAVPTLLPKKLTSLAAAVLFFVFGVKLLREGLAMSPDEGVGEEMKEVEAELAEKEHSLGKRRRSSVTPYALEAGTRGRRSRSNSRLPTHRSPSSSPARSPSPAGASLSNALNGLNNLFSLLLSPAWVQTFIMTFLGEWGDRSQIATIAMAAGQDYWWVTAGAVVGHGLCTSAAVLGGRAIAGKVSMRVVTLGGAIAFLVFGVIYLFESLYAD
ncbi:GCR1-dependent translation factor 1 [Neofusicoccum ribis]|uniref:GCR1-dependent translation factor 1 n=1 Tax=Neofusicoccum ribis TaxID=45134 RepID=A0ABR3T7J2_9PEZI